MTKDKPDPNMPNSVIKVSHGMPLYVVSLERTVKRHIVDWMVSYKQLT
jgi:hypothetical protein